MQCTATSSSCYCWPLPQLCSQPVSAAVAACQQTRRIQSMC
jgi:hypothetical protein